VKKGKRYCQGCGRPIFEDERKRIVQAVAEAASVSMKSIRSPSKDSRHTSARAAAAMLLHERLGLAPAQVVAYLNAGDRSNFYYWRKIATDTKRGQVVSHLKTRASRMLP